LSIWSLPEVVGVVLVTPLWLVVEVVALVAFCSLLLLL
jgi:hypothetical protein